MLFFSEQKLLELVVSLTLALLPIGLAGLCIVLLKRSIPALFLAICLLAYAMRLAFGDKTGWSRLPSLNGGPPLSILPAVQPMLHVLLTYKEQVDSSLLAVLLLGAGV